MNEYEINYKWNKNYPILFKMKSRELAHMPPIRFFIIQIPIKYNILGKIKQIVSMFI